MSPSSFSFFYKDLTFFIIHPFSEDMIILIAVQQNRPEPSRHKAGGAALGLSCAARFERSAGVFADRGDLANQFADRYPIKHLATHHYSPIPSKPQPPSKNQSAVSKVPCQISGLKLHGTTQKQAYNAKLARAVSHSSQKASRHSSRTNRPEPSRHKAGRAAPGLSCVARFERSAGVLADRGDLANQFADRAAS